MKFQGFCKKMLVVGLMASGLCFAGASAPVEAQQVNSSYAILIVGDESKADVAKSEKSLISEIASILESKNGSAFKYPKARSSRQVYSYHFNKDQEKRYCEKKLDILAEDVLFVGIIEVQPDRYPKRIVYRLDRVVNPQRSAKDVVARIEEFMTAESSGGSSTAAAPAAAAKSPAASPASAPSSAASAPASSASSNTAANAPAITQADRSDEGENGVYNRQQPKNAEIAISNIDTSNSWRCQVGAFASPDHARECYSLLRSKGHEGRIERVEVGDLIRYKVFVGTFSTRDEAVPTLNRLKDDGFKTAYICAPTR